MFVMGRDVKINKGGIWDAKSSREEGEFQKVFDGE